MMNDQRGFQYNEAIAHLTDENGNVFQVLTPAMDEDGNSIQQDWDEAATYAAMAAFKP